MIRVYSNDDYMHSLNSLSYFSTVLAENVFTFCRDLYQNRLRSFSISYVLTRYYDFSLKEDFLILASHIVHDLLHETLKIARIFDGKETRKDNPNDNTNNLFAIDELKLGFFFQ